MSKLACLLLLMTNIFCFAEDEDSLFESHHGTLSLYHDNDILNGTDRDYTSGLRVAWTSEKRNDLEKVPSIFRGLNYLSGASGSLDAFSQLWGFDKPNEVSYQYGTAVTQLMYTPTTFTVPIPPNERPYAGWLGLGFSLHTTDEIAMNSVELNLGVVGPSSFAEETQDTVHSLINSEIFEGWNSQIPDELTVNLNLKQTRGYTFFQAGDISYFPFSMNGASEASVSLGNFRTDASLGFYTQIGHNVTSEFSNPRLSTTANSTGWSDSQDSHFSAYLIFGAKVSAVLHDISLDGPVFRDFETNESSKPFVADLYYGLGLRYRDWEFSYVNTLRSKEYKSQQDSQAFSSIVVRIHL
jgi:lipid A 3-O-deacylase